MSDAPGLVDELFALAFGSTCVDETNFWGRSRKVGVEEPGELCPGNDVPDLVVGLYKLERSPAQITSIRKGLVAAETGPEYPSMPPDEGVPVCCCESGDTSKEPSFLAEQNKVERAQRWERRNLSHAASPGAVHSWEKHSFWLSRLVRPMLVCISHERLKLFSERKNRIAPKAVGTHGCWVCLCWFWAAQTGSLGASPMHLLG